MPCIPMFRPTTTLLRIVFISPTPTSCLALDLLTSLRLRWQSDTSEGGSIGGALGFKRCVWRSTLAATSPRGRVEDSYTTALSLLLVGFFAA